MDAKEKREKEQRRANKKKKKNNKTKKRSNQLQQVYDDPSVMDPPDKPLQSPAKSGTDESQADTLGYASDDTQAYDVGSDGEPAAGKQCVECTLCSLPWNSDWYCVSGCWHAIYCAQCSVTANSRLRQCPFCSGDTTGFESHCIPCRSAPGSLIYIDSF